MNYIPFIYMIESPGEQDIYDNRIETPSIKSISNLINGGFSSRMVYSKKLFLEAISSDFQTKFSEFYEINKAIGNTVAPVYIHISTHGFNGRGIVLTNGDKILWDELKNILNPINKLFGGLIILCLSSCYSLNGTNMISITGDRPFMYLVSSNGSIGWSDSATAFSIFYNAFEEILHSKIILVEKRMNFGSGVIKKPEAFKIIDGYEFQKNKKLSYTNLLKEYSNLTVTGNVQASPATTNFNGYITE